VRHVLPDGLVIEGHVLDALASLPAESLQMTITSPPYFGLRRYANDQVTKWADGQWAYGLEDSPTRWAEHTLEWLRGVRRVLRKDGTVWLNVGASYAGSNGTGGGPGDKQFTNVGSRREVPDWGISGYKPLDLIDPYPNLYPGLLADGWYVRSVIVWAKPNPMPESLGSTRWERHRVKVNPSARAESGAHVEAYGDSPQGARDGREFANHDSEWTDCPGCAKCERTDGLVLRRGSWRPTSSYEWIIMLAKSSQYYSDGEGVREPNHPDGRADSVFKGAPTYELENLDGQKPHERWPNPNGRNLRDVWALPTQPFPGAHFATYPEELVKRCILASTPDAGVCAVCGSPWARVIDATYEKTQETNGREKQELVTGWDRDKWPRMTKDTTTLGWRPTCAHSEATPATILDPFGGSGTSAVVARSLGRRFVLCELSSDYVQMALRRLSLTQPALAGFAW
jgi:DNA modification methylase